jgi:tRNA 2-thiouridine synthesizing protein E
VPVFANGHGETQAARHHVAQRGRSRRRRQHAPGPKEDGMAEVGYKDKTFEVDEDGFLLRFEDWSPEWVEYVRECEGIAEVTADHKKVMAFLQDYYKKNGIAPMVRILSKNTGYKLKEIYEFFPSGPSKGACKMAGLPKPTGCV